MAARCPHCGSLVEPERNAAGQLVCPLCRNTGRVASPQAAPPPSPPDIPTKVVVALSLGIAAILVFPLAIILGPIALVLGIQARRQLRRSPGTPGQGMATAAIVLGAVGILIGITVVIALVVVILVVNLALNEQWAFDVDDAGPGGTLTVTGYPGTPDWNEFELGGSAACTLPQGPVDYDDEIECTTDGTVLLLDAATGAELYSATV